MWRESSYVLQLQQKMPLFECLSWTFKKLISASTTFLSVAGASIEDTSRSLDWVPYIYYPLRFQKDTVEVKALIDSGSEVNAITPAYASKLGLWVCQTDVGALKIDGSTLKTFGMVLASF